VSPAHPAPPAHSRRLLPTIAVTSGEPAGIGPELCAALLVEPVDARVVVVGDRDLLARAAGRPWPEDRILHVPLAAPSQPGRLETANARYVLALLDAGIDGCLGGRFDALVTAPVHKGVINDAGIPFTGHTEYLAARCGTALPVMMLVGGGLRVALATTHLPLSRVSAALTAGRLEQVIRVLEADLREKFGVVSPRILVCGLNPHAGEGGHLGREEIEVIGPVLERLRAEGLGLTGPVPADTAFLPERVAGHDAVLAMFHDQGLPVLKHASFGHAVNVTLGLPIVRTSVDHGTALDLAGTGRADAGSLRAALRLAVELCAARRR
jgi:4-hydroxythreonine-4-phosphate dehydrogenase